MFSIAELFVIGGVAITSTLVAGVVLMEKSRVPMVAPCLPLEPVALLFADGVLHHATQRALATFAFVPGIHCWHDLRDALLDRFPDFPDLINTPGTGHMILPGTSDDARDGLRIDWRDEYCWIEILETDASNENHGDRRDGPRTEIAEVAVSHREVDGAKGKRSTTGEVRPQRVDPRSYALPSHADRNERPKPIATGQEASTEEKRDVTNRFPAKSSQRSESLASANTNSEATQSKLVQTIAKTFAHLSTGLAIFDRQGKLSIFNPALVDLTGLTPQFLANQPDVLSFFDQLRENRSMPEPKSYRTWRQDIARLITAAADGQYSETWSLEDGRTFAVKGRPHPDGAIAFMFEDISAEVSLSRNFRIEVAQYEAMLDATDDALVVFSATGILTFCNRQYRDLWKQDPEIAFADVTITDAIAAWGKDPATEIQWAEVYAFVTTIGQREERTIPVARRGGPDLICTLIPIMADATLVRFRASSRPLGEASRQVERVG